MIANRRAMACRFGSGSRSGWLVIEVVVALGLLAMAAGLILSMATWVMAARRGEDRRGRAMREAENAMERAMVAPFESLAAGSWPVPRDLAERVSRSLPGGEVEAKVERSSDPAGLDAARIEVWVTWDDRTGRRVRPVRLTAWRFDANEADR